MDAKIQMRILLVNFQILLLVAVAGGAMLVGGEVAVFFVTPFGGGPAAMGAAVFMLAFAFTYGYILVVYVLSFCLIVGCNLVLGFMAGYRYTVHGTKLRK